MFCGVVVCEGCRWEDGIRDGMVNEGQDSTTACWARSVASDGRKIGKIFEFGMGGEFGFLNYGYLDVMGVEEGGKFVVTVEDPIGVELEDVKGLVGRVWVRRGWRGCGRRGGRGVGGARRRG